jgi:sugar phosphate isomerase/epimerase
MKVGIDSYCYHRFFGEVYEDQKPPHRQWTMDDFLRRAKELEVDGVSLETCFLPNLEKPYLAELKAQLDEYGFERVFAWGHPDGLERGKSPEAFDEMKRLIPNARVMGANVMRVTGSSLMYRHEDHSVQIKALIAQFKEAVKIAEDNGVKLAVENHIDFTADEIYQILEGVNSRSFGVNFDTGNFLRLMDDPIAAMEKLAPHVFATHIKDLLPQPGAKPTDWFFFSGVPVGMGLIDNQRLAELLAKHNYQGFLAVEIDHPHSAWTDFEDEAVGISVKNLRKISESIQK